MQNLSMAQFVSVQWIDLSGEWSDT